MTNKTILYIGGFELPDLNAAAQRVVTNAKAFRALGNKVVFVNDNSNTSLKRNKLEYYGFECYEYKKRPLLFYLTSIKNIVDIVNTRKIDIIIAYNYPAIALAQLILVCKLKRIKCLADVTEWYQPTGNILYQIAKKIDTELRMRILHPKTDGIIAISKYLYEYYSDKVKTIELPPLIDFNDSKWHGDKYNGNNKTTFIYAGSPSMEKENLIQIISAVETISCSESIVFNIIGITALQFEKMYSTKIANSSCIKFLGIMTHKETICMTKNSDWTIIYRNNNLTVKAGFPTKLVESITCGTPLIVNRFSNIEDYIDDNDCIIFETYSELCDSIARACKFKLKPDMTKFDYHKYLDKYDEIII